MEVEMIWAQKMVVAVTVESQWIAAAQEVEDFEMSEHDVVAVAAAAAHDVEWQWIECSLTVVAAAALRKSVCVLGEQMFLEELVVVGHLLVLTHSVTHGRQILRMLLLVCLILMMDSC